MFFSNREKLTRLHQTVNLLKIRISGQDWIIWDPQGFVFHFKQANFQFSAFKCDKFAHFRGQFLIPFACFESLL